MLEVNPPVAAIMVRSNQVLVCIIGGEKDMTSQLSQAARRYLEEKHFAVLATINRDGTPQQSTVWYIVEDEFIMLNTKRGRLKDRNLVRDPRASACIANGYTYVTIRGRATLIDDQAIAQPDIKRLSTRYHDAEKAELQMRDQFSKEERITILLSIDRVDEYGIS
jgi:PPOX class probable F420-dependent enzyme